MGIQITAGTLLGEITVRWCVCVVGERGREAVCLEGEYHQAASPLTTVDLCITQTWEYIAGQCRILDNLMTD